MSVPVALLEKEKWEGNRAEIHLTISKSIYKRRSFKSQADQKSHFHYPIRMRLAGQIDPELIDRCKRH